VTARFWLIILAAALIIAGLVAGRIHDRRAIPAPPPLTVPVALFADRDDEWEPAAAPEAWWWNAATQTLRPMALRGEVTRWTS
jgi:hypothetical protein